jgi:hypothetical protein
MADEEPVNTQLEVEEACKPQCVKAWLEYQASRAAAGAGKGRVALGCSLDALPLGHRTMHPPVITQQRRQREGARFYCCAPPPPLAALAPPPLAAPAPLTPPLPLDPTTGVRGARGEGRERRGALHGPVL